MAAQSDSKQRLYDWIKAVLVVFAVGPPIGGFVIGLMLAAASVLSGTGGWEYVPVVLIVSPVVSYILGLPVAALAVVLFIPSSRLVSRGTRVLAAVCGVVSAALLIGFNEIMRLSVPAGLQMQWRDFVLQLVVLGIPSGVSGWVCWHVTRSWHRLS